MKRIILFRFHSHAELCVNRIRRLCQYNPGVPIYGLYGGEAEQFERMQRTLAAEVEHVDLIEGKTAVWRWKHGDLATVEWFRKYRSKVDFDILHLVEWDLLLLSPLDELYRDMPIGAVALTAPRKVAEVYGRWEPWLSREPFRADWSSLLSWVQARYALREEPVCCFGPGWSVPRRFLEAYATASPPEYCHDELRLPLFAQALGFPIYDTGFCKNWFSSAESEFFNCDGKEVQPATIVREMRKPAGRRVFHPYRRAVP